MALSILALCLFIFGAYAYGSVVVLTLRHRTSVWSGGARSPARPDTFLLDLLLPALAMYIVCTLWFILHSIIEFRFLMGEPRENDLIDLAALELACAFPGLIFHTVLLETSTECEHPRGLGRGALLLRAGLYLGGLAMAIYFPAAIFDLVAAPPKIGPFIGLSIAALFTVSSAGSLWLVATKPRPTATRDELRLRASMMILFVAMIAMFSVMSFMQEHVALIDVVGVLVRTTPLLFLVVSVYFENRTEFYDLVIKRGVIMLLSLLILASALALSLGWIEQMPDTLARPWLFAVALLPFAMILPWLHDRVGRLLDRLWFGREFTPVEAVKHVLGAMQQATDEASLIKATEATLSEMFRRRVMILFDDHEAPQAGMVDAEIALPGASQPFRMAIVHEPGSRPVLSEDLALLRSLGSVFGFMLENVRLHRRRHEQEQIAQELRLQTSRSELKALRAQINPHFLFNALNAIASLIHTDPTRADAAVEQLAEVFRYTLRRSDQEWTTLDQELAFARAYLEVEQARFGRRLEFSIDADPALGSAQVPSMLLQTLVENAVKHGISRLRHPGRIVVTAGAADDLLMLEVRDTGPGLDNADRQRPSTGESFGLRSVRDRLQGHFGDRASLEISRDEAEGLTVARIAMPLVTDESAVATLLQ